MLTMIGAINEFERENLLERQREGIAIAKKQGKYKGRKGVAIKDFEKHYNRYMSREISKSALAKELKISRAEAIHVSHGDIHTNGHIVRYR